MNIFIPVHSSVNLITNSSSEIFIFASNQTVTVAKDLINQILKLAGSISTADDLFKIKLVYGVKGESTDYDWKHFDSEDLRQKYIDEQEEKGDYYSESLGTSLSIVSKGKNPETKLIAETFLKLFGTLDGRDISTN